MMKVFACCALLAAASAPGFFLGASGLTAPTLFSAERCEGSRMPYPAPDSVVEWPDSLVPVMINHVGRHGARFPTSAKRFGRLAGALERAESGGTLTRRGRLLLQLTRRAMADADGRWGELDSLGVAEQRGIARRMFEAFPQLFVGQKVDAISSYVARCVASMDAFTAQINELADGRVTLADDSGREFSPLLRPFEVDSVYVEFAAARPYAGVLDAFAREVSPAVAVAGSMVGGELAAAEADEVASDIYYVVSALSAMGLSADWQDFFSLEEYNRMWAVDNLRQYLSRTATTVSAVPAEIASALVGDLVRTTDDFISGADVTPVRLRFGHAETIMPLASLMRLPGCYYLTYYFDTVASHWQNWNVVPMAANIRLILFRSQSGRYYVRTELNERPLELIPGCRDLYVPWERARNYLVAVAGL